MKMLKEDQGHARYRVRVARAMVLCAAAVLVVCPSLRAANTNNVPPVALPVTDDSAPAPSGTAVAASMNSMDALNEKTKLNNGDRVSYRVVEEEQEPKYLTVSDSGELDVPLVGRVEVSGKSCKEVAYAIKPVLEKKYFYHATVIIGLETFSTRSRGKVYLMGEVAKQGAVEIPATETLTVSRAILLDGGLGDFADRHKVKLVRKKPDGTSETTIVDLVDILDRGHTDRDPVLKPEDMIIVPARLFNY